MPSKSTAQRLEKTPREKQAPIEVLIRCWQTSETVEEVGEKLGKEGFFIPKPESIRLRINQWRNKKDKDGKDIGVKNLKLLGTGAGRKPADTDKLSQLALECLPGAKTK